MQQKAFDKSQSNLAPKDEASNVEFVAQDNLAEEKDVFWTTRKMVIVGVSSLLVLIAIAVPLGVILPRRDHYVPRLQVPNQITTFQYIPGYSYNYKVQSNTTTTRPGSDPQLQNSMFHFSFLCVGTNQTNAQFLAVAINETVYNQDGSVTNHDIVPDFSIVSKQDDTATEVEEGKMGDNQIIKTAANRAFAFNFSYDYLKGNATHISYPKLIDDSQKLLIAYIIDNLAPAVDQKIFEKREGVTVERPGIGSIVERYLMEEKDGGKYVIKQMASQNFTYKQVSFLKDNDMDSSIYEEQINNPESNVSRWIKFQHLTTFKLMDEVKALFEEYFGIANKENATSLYALREDILRAESTQVDTSSGGGSGGVRRLDTYYYLGIVQATFWKCTCWGGCQCYTRYYKHYIRTFYYRYQVCYRVFWWRVLCREVCALYSAHEYYPL